MNQTDWSKNAATTHTHKHTIHNGLNFSQLSSHEIRTQGGQKRCSSALELHKQLQNTDGLTVVLLQEEGVYSNYCC